MAPMTEKKGDLNKHDMVLVKLNVMQVKLHKKQDSLFGLVTRLGDKKQRQRDSIPGRDKSFFYALNWADCPCGQPSFLSGGHHECFPRE